MKEPISHGMNEAARLTKLGLLGEATALIQKLLRGAVGASSPHGAAASAPTLDLKAEPDAAAYAGGAAEPTAETLTRGLRTPKPRRDLRNLVKRAPRVEDVVPSVGTIIAGSFANDAGRRTYKLYVPSDHGGKPHPLIVMLHGCGQSADDFAAGTRMNFEAEKRSAYVVYPEQLSSANPSKCWNWYEPANQQRDKGEPSLIVGIVSALLKEHNVDPARVYVAGLSAGGAAAIVAAEAYPEIFAAVGVHSGLASGVARDLPSAFAAMSGQPARRASQNVGPADANRAAKPTIVFHGDRDATVHPGNAAAVVAQASGGREFSSASERGKSENGRDFTRTIQRDPSGRNVIERWDVHGAGHAWSGGSSNGSFTDPAGPSATKEMLRFFLEHSRTKI